MRIAALRSVVSSPLPHVSRLASSVAWRVAVVESIELANLRICFSTYDKSAADQALKKLGRYSPLNKGPSPRVCSE